MADKEEKNSHTLARFLEDDHLKTENIDLTKQFAHRNLGRYASRRIIDALERVERKKEEKK